MGRAHLRNTVLLTIRQRSHTGLTRKIPSDMRVKLETGRCRDLWADEYWTVYPDGVAIRKQVLWSSNLDPEKHEFQETIVLNGTGQRPKDNIHFDAVVLANMKGETAAYTWTPRTQETFNYPQGPKDFPKPEAANIQWINLKSERPILAGCRMPLGSPPICEQPGCERRAIHDSDAFFARQWKKVQQRTR